MMGVLLLGRNRPSTSQNFFFVVMIAAEGLISLRKSERFEPLVKKMPSTVTTAQSPFLFSPVIGNVV